MTIREFAKLCDVSPATVSRYFSGGTGLSPAIAKNIQQMVDQTGYTPATRMRKSKAGCESIVVFNPIWRHSFFNELLTYLEQTAQKMGFQMLVLPSREPDLKKCLNLLRSISPMGVLLLDELNDDPLAEMLYQQQYHTVVCGALSLKHLFPAVHIDDMAAAYDGANYLIDLGHKNLGLISAKPQSISSGFQRIMGCKKAMEDAGLSLPDKHIVYGGSSVQDGYFAMNQLFERRLPISAVFAFSDDMAAGALASIMDHGLSVPNDISVMAFDNCVVSLETRPHLTTIAQPIDLIATRSLELLCDYPETPESITLPHTIKKRASCKTYLAPRELEVLYESNQSNRTFPPEPCRST